jgi:hypothetical protein
MAEMHPNVKGLLKGLREAKPLFCGPDGRNTLFAVHWAFAEANAVCGRIVLSRALLSVPRRAQVWQSSGGGLQTDAHTSYGILWKRFPRTCASVNVCRNLSGRCFAGIKIMAVL